MGGSRNQVNEQQLAQYLFKLKHKRPQNHSHVHCTASLVSCLSVCCLESLHCVWKVNGRTKLSSGNGDFPKCHRSIGGNQSRHQTRVNLIIMESSGFSSSFSHLLQLTIIKDVTWDINYLSSGCQMNWHSLKGNLWSEESESISLDFRTLCFLNTLPLYLIRIEHLMNTSLQPLPRCDKRR